MIRDPWHTTPLGVAATTLGVGSVIGLVGWPCPSAYALAALVGAGALVVGVRMLRGELGTAPAGTECAGCVGCGGPDCIERPAPYPTPETNWGCPCGMRQLALGYREAAVRMRYLGDDPAAVHLDEWAEHLEQQLPDTSGPNPDTRTDTHPDTPGHPGQDDADQDGHHPDSIRTPADNDLRERVAAALLARIKQAVFTEPQPFNPGPVGHLLAATEYDLADTVLAALRPELDRAEEAEAALARVRELHRKANNGDTCVYCAHGQRLGYDTTWPCDTIRALDTPTPAAETEA